LSRRQYRAGTTLAAVLLAAVPAHAAGAFRVKLQGLGAAIAGTVSGMPGVAVVAGDGDYDMLIVQGDDGFRLTHPSGDPIASYGPARWPEVLKRISRQAAVQGLIDLEFADQAFKATIAAPGNRGSLQEGEPFAIEFSVDRDSHVLLLDVDAEGYVSVLYPSDAAEARPVRQGRVPATGELKVSPPFGTDYVKLIAFEEKPEGFDQWTGQSGKPFSPTSPELGRLLRMIKDAKGGKAQARLKLVTRGRSG